MTVSCNHELKMIQKITITDIHLDFFNTTKIKSSQTLTDSRLLAKEWKRGAAPLYAVPFHFDVAKGMQLNHKYV